MSLTIDNLRNIATEQSFQKGINYYEMDLVNNPVIDETHKKNSRSLC